MTVTIADVDRFERALERAADLEKLRLHLYTAHGGTDLMLDTIQVAKGKRKEGRGTAAMQEIVKFADAHGLRVRLTPALADDRWGTTSRARLVQFYKRFGFVENKGRHKDFVLRADEMYRKPRRM